MKWPITKLLAYSLFSMPVALCAQSDESILIWESLRQADSDLAESSRAVGVNRAFLDSFAEGAIIFREGPVDARNLYEQASPLDRSRTALDSRANFIDFSRAGDLGLTSGPYRYTSEQSGNGPQRRYGHFVTIWRNYGSEWRMVADMVVRVPGVLSIEVEADIAETYSVLAESAPVTLTEANTLESLLLADDRFITSINVRGGRRAALRYGIDNQRVYVPGMVPGIGSESGSMVYGTYLDGKLSTDELLHERSGAYMSISGDVGYTYGIMKAENAGFNANYLRYWRFTPEGEWSVAVEVLNEF